MSQALVFFILRFKYATGYFKDDAEEADYEETNPADVGEWNEKYWLKPELFEQRELMRVKLVLSIETKDVGMP